MEEEEQGEEAAQKKKAAHHKESEALAARSALGSAVRLHLMAENKKKKPSELFLPGRSTFEFALDDDFGEIPTTKSKSVEDLPPQARERRVAMINKNIITSITTIYGYIRCQISLSPPLPLFLSPSLAFPLRRSPSLAPSLPSFIFCSFSRGSLPQKNIKNNTLNPEP